MKIVLDTNVLIACISRKSQYNIIFQKILKDIPFPPINVISAEDFLSLL